MWRQNALLVSMPTVGILLPQMLWVVDFLGWSLVGIRITGMTAYMFNSTIPLFVRGLSSFHGWLPFALLFLVWRLGYDRRACLWQALLAVGLLGLCYAIGPDPPASARGQAWAGNINYVYGMDDGHPQTTMPASAWLLLMIATNVVAFYIPTHLFLRHFAPSAGYLNIRSSRLTGS